MSAPEKKPIIRKKPGLIAAATASNSAVTPQPTPASQTPPLTSTPPRFSSQQSNAAGSTSNLAIRAGSTGSASSSVRSTPVLADGSFPPAMMENVNKMKFKPKVPIRKVKQEPDVKPDISTSAPPTRGAPRGRGRGGSTRGGRGGAPSGPVQSQSIAAGPLGGPRPSASSSSRRFVASVPSFRPTEIDTELYSDNEDAPSLGRQAVIDIDAVSGLSESAPTSLYRDRRLTEGVKAKSRAKKEEKERIKGRYTSTRRQPPEEAIEDEETKMDVDVDYAPNVASAQTRVKDEPTSPVKPRAILPDRASSLNEGIPPPIGYREDDTMISDDEEQDRDVAGRRVRAFARTGGIDEDEEVNEAQKVDLSESEEEEEEETMEGDFIAGEGDDSPEDKLFMFQFPHLFPKFHPNTIDLTAKEEDAKEDVKDVKPNQAQLRGNKKKGGVPPAEGRIGTLVVMKSGKVKMVLGDGIVMDVSPGVAATFLQTLNHLDQKTHSATVLGEITKSYVVTPDIDRLLSELYVNGNKTPGDVERQKRKETIRVKMEGGGNLLKIED